MCEKKECLRGKNELCTCEALKSNDIMARLAHVMQNMWDVVWEFDYTTLSRPENRRLCVTGTCRLCGGRLCSSIDLDDTAFGDDLLAMAYRNLWQFSQTGGSMDSMTFRAKFVELFHERDRIYIREWLERPENKSVYRMYRGRHPVVAGKSQIRHASSAKTQSVHLYTIIRSGADADQGNFPSPYPEGSFFSRERARTELARLVDEEKKSLNKHFDKIEEDEDFWEACENGYAAAHFTRLEIVSSELNDIDELINSGELDGCGTSIPPLSDFADLEKYRGER